MKIINTLIRSKFNLNFVISMSSISLVGMRRIFSTLKNIPNQNILATRSSLRYFDYQYSGRSFYNTSLCSSEIQSPKASSDSAFDIERDYGDEIEDIMSKYEEKRKRRQALVGVVVSDKCAKSVVVRVAYRRFVQKYNKHLTMHKKIMAHDEGSVSKEGDMVRIAPCRPMSRKKRHQLMDIIRRPKTVAWDGTGADSREEPSANDSEADSIADLNARILPIPPLKRLTGRKE